MSVVNSASGLLASLLELLFPGRCPGCGRRGPTICEQCWPSIPWLGVEVCPICASPSRLARICRRCSDSHPVLNGARAACRFEGITRKAIHDLKFRGIRGRATVLGDLVVEALDSRPLAIDLLVPIPLGRARRRQRGFNQSELIAQRIGERLGVPVSGSSLERVRETSPQVRRSREERRANVDGVFKCSDPALVAGRRIALIDDVMTTGATLDAGASALKAHGADRVYGLVVAREI
jgi:competence protein ComFC